MPVRRSQFKARPSSPPSRGNGGGRIDPLRRLDLVHARDLLEYGAAQPRSGRQLLAGLLPDDVLGVPVRPALIVLAGPLLVFAMRGRRASERGREFG